VRELVNAERKIFPPFYELYRPDASAGYPIDAQLLRATELFARFFEDYESARHPRTDPTDMVPMRLTVEQIDELLTRIEVWNLRK
jgi:hypothetical protein